MMRTGATSMLAEAVSAVTALRGGPGRNGSSVCIGGRVDRVTGRVCIVVIV